MKKDIHILIPTFKRLKALAVTLTSLCYQSEQGFDIVISDQSPENELSTDASIATLLRLLELQGHEVKVMKNLPLRGMAQQRHFLLQQVHHPYCLFLDDDLILEPYVIRNMKRILQSQSIGFAGMAVIGLSYLHDHRPQEETVAFWKGEAEPEEILPDTEKWERYKLHNAANVFHLQQRLKLSPDAPVAYKIAWVGGCVLYDTAKLRQAGGFDFYRELPSAHCGEDVMAQISVMKKYGGCGVLPSGVYHQELKTTLPDRSFNIPEHLPV